MPRGKFNKSVISHTGSVLDNGVNSMYAHKVDDDFLDRVRTDKQCYEWCTEVFGMEDGDRWKVVGTPGVRSFHFRDEADYNWFVLRWT